MIDLIMMPVFPYVHLPADFLKFLSLISSPSPNLIKKADLFIQKNPSLHQLLKLHFREIDSQGRPEVIMRSLGINGLRDRLAVLYLSRQEADHFYQLNPILLSEILILEDKLNKFSIENQRAFTIGFYLKMASLRPNNSFSQKKILPHFTSEIFQCLNLMISKSWNIDWPLLMIWHLNLFLGTEKFQSMLKSTMNFSMIFEECEEKQKKLLLFNVIKYCASIQEQDVFSAHTDLNFLANTNEELD